VTETCYPGNKRNRPVKKVGAVHLLNKTGSGDTKGLVRVQLIEMWKVGHQVVDDAHMPPGIISGEVDKVVGKKDLGEDRQNSKKECGEN
jgi:hypothetical protein